MKTSYFLMPAFFLLITTTSFNSKDVTPVNYEKHKQEIQLEKMKLKTQYDSATIEERDKLLIKASGYLEKKLVNQLIPAWYGTPWDFNGYSAVPGQGKIACGYFVSTVLKHAGFNLNRYKLAQKDAYGIVKAVSENEKLQEFWNINRDDFLKTAQNNLKNGLFVIGLDSHVGFLLKQDDGIWFIHSNYRVPVAVVKEKALESEALNDSHVFILSRISGNEGLIEAWIQNVVIKT